jgi:hypothetical protein
MQQEASAGDISDRDDTLAVLFMCCHPALTPASAIALTLRAAGGLTTAEIASAFLVSEATMAQRIARAKQRIAASGEPFSLPGPDERPERTGLVLRVLYLIFNEGYASSAGGELQRTELSAEAIRLARMVHRLLPEDGEAGSLLALMLLVDARRRPGPGPPASWSRWPSRTEASGIGRSSPRASPCSTTRWASGPLASTGSRPRSQRSTTGLHGPRRPTGRRSSRCTGCSSS